MGNNKVEEIVEKLNENLKDVPSRSVSQEEIDEAYEKYLNHKTLVSDIAHYKGIHEKQAEKIALKVYDSQRKGYIYDWTKSDIDFGVNSYYYYSRYETVCRLEKVLSDKEMVKYAKKGVLSHRIDELKKKHPITYNLYLKINSLVREAYYAYLVNMSRLELEDDRDDILAFLNRDINALNFWINYKSAARRKESNQGFNEYANNCIKSAGIIRDDSDVWNIVYSSGSFDKDIYAIAKAIKDYESVNILKEAIDVIKEKIERIKEMSIEEYRTYKIDSMLLTDSELKLFEENTEKYKESYNKALSKVR